MEPFLDAEKFKPKYGTPARGVEGRDSAVGSGTDYSQRIRNNSGYRTPEMRGTIQPQETTKYDPRFMNHYWSRPEYTSYARSDLSHPGYVPV